MSHALKPSVKPPKPGTETEPLNENNEKVSNSLVQKVLNETRKVKEKNLFLILRNSTQTY